MKDDKKGQSQEITARLDYSEIPEQVIKNFSLRLLKLLKTDEGIQKRYEQETGKTFYK